MKVRPRLGVVVLHAAIAGWTAFHFIPEPLPELSREEFLAEVRAGHVRKVIIEDQEVITGSSRPMCRCVNTLPYDEVA